MMVRAAATLSLVSLLALPARAEEEVAAAAPAEPPADSTEEATVEEAPEMDVDPAVFDNALDDYYAKSYAAAAAGFWAYLKSADQAAEQYEWAQFFLAECMRELDLYHAAVQYYFLVAKTRSRPEILPIALERLEEISRQRPFSETLIYEDLVYDSEFGFLPEVLGNWVQYVQGYYDYRNDFVDWAARHFDQISRRSPYYLRALYVKAVYALKKKKDDEALATFDAIVSAKVDDSDPLGSQDIKNRAHLAMARLLFDLGEYEQALEQYAKVEQIDLSFEQAQLLLEKAWTAYYLGEHRKAMGLLHALKAPSYTKFFLPDAYILRGIILKQLCHFIPAKRVVRDFRFNFNRALEDVRKRMPLEKVRMITLGATQEGTIARRTAFLRTLESERKAIGYWDSQWEDVGLDKHLRTLYDFEMREQARLWRIDFRAASDAAALTLLESEEQINLLDYEIGLDIFKRLKAEAARREAVAPLTIPYDSVNVYYEFEDEFWNDELHSYEYFIKSRCFEGEVAQ